MTLWRDALGFSLTTNRDERRARAAEHAPEIRAGRGAAWLAPADGASGGTWIGVNCHGVAACLLNVYGVFEAPASAESRGAIIPRLLERGAWRAGLRWMQDEFDPWGFAPFTLVMVSPHAALSWRWEGRGPLAARRLGPGWSMLTSSSWNTEAVERWRAERFAEWVARDRALPGAEIPDFHFGSVRGEEAWSVLMARPESSTRSITQVRVDRDATEARMVYVGDPAAAPEKRTAHGLPLRAWAQEVAAR